MKKYCMHPGCTREAIWGIKAENERDMITVCAKHSAQTIDGYQRLGHTPKIIALTE